MIAHDYFAPLSAAILRAFPHPGIPEPKTPMNQKRKTRARASGMTQISISLPEGLIPVIDQMATSENRNRSNFIANTLQALATERGITAARPLPKAT